MKHQQIIFNLPYSYANSACLNKYYLLTLLMSQLDEGDSLVNFRIF